MTFSSICVALRSHFFFIIFLFFTFDISFILGKMNELELMVQDLHGSTPLHIAAQCGVSLYLDLLAPRGIALALVTKDKQGP